MTDEATMIERVRGNIREVPSFPQDGVLFYDITPVLQDADLFSDAVELMVDRWTDEPVDVVAAIESRGFIFGGTIAYLLDVGFVPIRKLGKLPHETLTREYALEYGTNTLEIHSDAIHPGQRVLLVDDVLATGGTIEASIALIRQLGGDPIAVSVLIELDFLEGRQRLTDSGVDIYSYIRY